jgi:hypothetical protein
VVVVVVSKPKSKFSNNYDRPWKCSILHRLKFIGIPECPCKHGVQTLDYLIFQCKRLKNEREILKNSVLKVDKWPAVKVN